MDDILLFTATTKGEPYIGLIDGSTQPLPIRLRSSISSAARTLYRRVLLIKPEIGNQQKLARLTVDGATRTLREVPPQMVSISRYDLSVHKTWDDDTATSLADAGGTQDRPVLAANTLADSHATRDAVSRTIPIHASLDGFVPQETNDRRGVTATPKFAQRQFGTLRYWREGKPFPFFLRPWLGSPYPDPVDANFTWVPGPWAANPG